MKFVIKYWAQITGILAILAFLFGWCWRLAVRFDSLVTTVGQHEKRLNDHDTLLAEHDSTLDEHSNSILVSNKIEELREKGLMK
jgi:hypothetical protein